VSLLRRVGQFLVTEDNLRGPEPLNAEWVDHAMARTRHQRIILDMDSSESPVYGEQEGAADNGHFECVSYHPSFCFNQLGDGEGAVLSQAMCPAPRGGERHWRPSSNGTDRLECGCISERMLPLQA